LSDIVERLMSAERRYRDADRHEARDEIVRLRAEVGELQQTTAEWREAYEDVEAERDRLREVLDHVAVLGHGKCTIGKPLADMIRAELKGDAP
jgi:hypothetical protein